MPNYMPQEHLHIPFIVHLLGEALYPTPTYSFFSFLITNIYGTQPKEILNIPNINLFYERHKSSKS